MNVTIALVILGTDEAPLWASTIRRDATASPYWRFCCEGHHAPEAAAAHGTELAAAWLSREARALKPPAYGALVLQAAA